MNKKLKKGLTVSSAAAMGMSIVLPTVSVIAAPAVATNGWANQNGTWYYYNNGTLVKNGWAKDSKGWCFLSAVDGSWVQEGWAKDSTGWGYIKDGYWVQHATYAKDANGWEFIGSNGYWDSSVAAVATNPIDDATAAVVKAEGSKLAADVDAAKAAIAKLQDAIPEKAALTTRLNAINVTFEVASVTVVDANHVAVAFTQALDEATATDTSNYKITNDTLTVDEANLQSDGKTVILKLDDNTVLTNDSGDDYTVKVTGVKNTDGKEIPDYKEIVNLYDSVKPTVTDTTMKNRDELDVTFSEDVTDVNTTNVKVYDSDGSKVNVTVARDKDDHNVIDITGLGSEDSGDYTVVFNNVKDLAGNKVAADTTKDFTLEDDTTAPKVSSITGVSDNTLEVTFSEPVDISGGNFDVVTVPGLTVKSISAVGGTSKKSFYVQFTTDQDESTSYKVTVSNYVDFADNEGDSKTKFVKFGTTTPAVSDTAATVKTFDGTKYAVVTFDQNVNDFTKPADMDATYTDKDGDEISTTIDSDKVLTSNSYDPNNASLDMSDYLDDNQIAINLSGLDKGDYTVTLPEGLVDLNGSTSDETDVTFSLSEDDTSTVYVESVTKDSTKNDVYYVKFSDKVDASALDTSNYKVNGDTVFKSASFTNTDKDTVKLTVDSGSIDTSGTYTFKTKNIVDSNGNDVDDYSGSIYFTNSIGPSIDKAVLVDLDTIQVYFDEGITQGTVNDKDFKVTVDGTAVSIDTATAAAGSNGTVWTITLKDDISDDYTTVKAGTSDAFDGKDANGNKGDVGTMVTAKVGDAYVASATDAEKALAAAKAAVPADLTIYTTDSVAVLNTALAMPESTDAQAAAKATAINSAVTALVKIADADTAATNALTAAKAAANALVPSQYADFTAVTNAMALPESTTAEKVAKTTAINTAINGLAKTPAATVAAAKAAAITALNSYNATNSTTQAQMLAVVDTAIANSSVTSSFSAPFNKTNAIVGTAGSITGTITLTDGVATATIVLGTDTNAMVIPALADTVAPTAVATWTDANTDYSAESVLVTFSEAMDPATLVKANFSSTAGIASVVVGGGNTTATVTFTNPLAPNGTLAISSAVKDVAGNSTATGTLTNNLATTALATAKSEAITALNGIVGDNTATTEASVLTAVDAGITNNNVTSAFNGTFVKTAATNASAGSVTGTITLTLAGVTTTVPVNIVIACLDAVAPTAVANGNGTATEIDLTLADHVTGGGVNSTAPTVSVVSGGTFTGSTYVNGSTISLGAAATNGQSVSFKVTDAAGNSTSYTATWDGTKWTIA